jgi:hypothetical protein
LLFLRVDKKEDGVNPKTNFCLRKKNIYRMLYREKLGNLSALEIGRVKNKNNQGQEEFRKNRSIAVLLLK